MKIRNGFVSSSFTVYKKDLDLSKEFIVKNYNKLPDDSFGSPDEWSIHETANAYIFETMMDNYNLIEAFKALDIKLNNKYHSNGYWEEDED
jgi:hypothetical protein